MKPMVMGSEHEYTLFSHQMNPRGIDPHRLALEVLRKSQFAAQGEWLKNGSRAYFDVGHLEISTPETLTPFDMLRYEKAGERIVDLARLKLEEFHSVKINAYKNNTDPDGVSYGSHENYCVPRNIDFPAMYLKNFVAHLVTRIVFCGAGDFIDRRYVLSPCAYLTSELVSGGNLSNTGILHTRDEPHADPTRWRRLHVIIGDALMGEIPIYLRAFSTAGVLQAMERGYLDDAPQLREPLRDMWHMVEQVAPEQWKMELTDGRWVTPMEIQRYYLTKVEQAGLVETQEEKQALAMWEEILEKLEAGNIQALRRRVEWVARLIEVEKMIDLKGRDENVELAAAKQYSELNELRGIYHRLVHEKKLDTMLSEEDVKSAILQPPQNTRAKARVQLLEDYEMGSIDWSEMSILTEDGGYERIHLPDPYNPEPTI
ncbi:MAG TPA: proteasome accessory factor PafA2 family protein [Candidatus Thermoplasmatota archaeon]|nr:proteasome accessory factor PafA2 family protein [Candidatus Thermoplasmatota archaeon]